MAEQEPKKEEASNNASDTDNTKKPFPNQKQCRYCDELIRPSAKVCRYCNRHQNRILNCIERITTLAALASIIMVVIAVSQLKMAHDERISAKEALNLANQAKNTALLAAQDANESFKKTEKLQRITELLVEGVAFYNNKNYKGSLAAFGKILSIEPENEFAMGLASVMSLLEAKRANDANEKSNMLNISYETLTKYCSMSKKNEDNSVYLMAAILAMMGNEQGCKDWLGKAVDANTLPSKNDVIKSGFFGNVQNKEWFNQLPWPKN